MGKGSLAISIAQWSHDSPDHQLILVVPVVPEPTWAPSLISWCRDHDVTHVASGRVEDIPGVREAGWGIDLAFSSSYDRILKQWFIDKCGQVLNLHNSALPKYRGMSPINWALRRGEDLHGVTIHEITAGIDEGPIVGQLKYSIYPDVDEVQDVYQRAIEYGRMLFEQTMKLRTEITPRDQDHSQAEYFTKAMRDRLGDRRDFTRRTSVDAQGQPE